MYNKNMGLILVSIGRIVMVICYLGGVCDFHNQLQTTITAKNRIAKGLTAFKWAFNPSFAAA